MTKSFLIVGEAHIMQPMLDFKEDCTEDFETTAEVL